MDKKFLDKVVDQIVSETRIDYEKDTVNFPFLISSFCFSFHYCHSHVFSYSPYLPPPFLIHCKDVYSLNDVEVSYVWDKYKQIIKDKIKSKDNINESTGMNYNFLDKVVKQIVDETVLDYSEGSMGTIEPPFTYGNLMSLYHFPTKKNTFFYDSFISHCKNTYGIRDDNEMEYIWYEFVTTINDKVRHKGNINESNIVKMYMG
jgi:hypothetical protein